MNLDARIDRLEIMDTETLPLPVMREILSFLQITNKYFGGEKLVLNYLDQWSQNWEKNKIIRILDVGTGRADIPISIAKWARAKNFKLELTAIDLVPEIVSIAKVHCIDYPEIEVECKNIFDLNNERFDYVTASLLFHHISPNQSLTLLQTFDKIAGRGIIISDLKRSLPSYWAVKILSFLIGNKIVRYDAPLSVRRAFNIEELISIAKEAGLHYLAAQYEPFFRISLTGEKK